MKLVVKGLALAALLGMAACADNANRPTDVGNMATPAPARPGIVDPTIQGRDVGSMQEPRATGGVRVRESTTRDTGSMALPSAAQGNSTPRRNSP